MCSLWYPAAHARACPSCSPLTRFSSILGRILASWGASSLNSMSAGNDFLGGGEGADCLGQASSQTDSGAAIAHLPVCRSGPPPGAQSQGPEGLSAGALEWAPGAGSRAGGLTQAGAAPAGRCRGVGGCRRAQALGRGRADCADPGERAWPPARRLGLLRQAHVGVQGSSRGCLVAWM